MVYRLTANAVDEYWCFGSGDFATLGDIIAITLPLAGGALCRGQGVKREAVDTAVRTSLIERATS